MNTKKQMYRDTENARIAGVCAGIANYFNIERWLVRILFVTGFFLLAGPFVLVLYVAAWFILEKQPVGGPGYVSANMANVTGKPRANSAHDPKIEVKTKVWQAGEPPKQAFKDISSRFCRAEQRLRKIETYVTSKEFQLNREFNNL